MSSLSTGGRAWWAANTNRARGAALGAIALTAGLATASVAVWVSPTTSPVTRVTELYEAVTEPARDENAALLDRVAELNAQLQVAKAELGGADDDAVALQAEIETLQQQVWSLEGQLQADAVGDAEREAALRAGGDGPSAGAGSGAGGSSGGGTGSGGGTTTPTISAPSKAQIVSPASSYFGMYTEQSPFNWAGLDGTAARIGSKPDIAGYFGGWDQRFRPDAVQRSWQRGMLPLLTWESRPIAAPNDVVDEPEYALPRILEGDFDRYLRTYARDIRKTGLPLAIRLNHEMNGDWYPWSEKVNGNREGDYVKMWRHVHDIFEQEGANDLVVWVWAPNRIDKLLTSMRTPEYLASLYPGDEYVDWVGMSGYLRPPYSAGTEFTFEETFGRTLVQLRQVSDRPILLAEIGASEAGNNKPHWISSLFKNLAAPENDDIVGFSWFNHTVTSTVGGERVTNDWRIDSRSDSLEAFRRGLLAEGSGFIRRPA